MAVDRSIFSDIEANLPALEIDEIKGRLEHLLKGFSIASPVFDPGAFVYRGRRVTPSFNKAGGIVRGDLTYPPGELAQLRRLNRPSVRS